MSVTIAKNLKPQWYTPYGQDKESTPAQFLLKPLSSLAHMDVSANIRFIDEDIGKKPEDRMMVFKSPAIQVIIRECILEWKNIVDSDGAPIEFSISACEDLSPALLKDIAFECVYQAELSQAQKKTLPSQSE